MSRVAVIGTGRMGSAMARSLARADLPPVLYNRTAARAAALASEIDGALAVATPGEAAMAADIVITMLADDEAVRAVYEQLATAARPDNVFVDMSTIMPSTITDVARAIRGAGATIIDAPVSGSVQLAESGELTVMAGGEAADLDRARLALEPLAKAIFHLGPLGAGAAMKLAVNAVIFGLNVALGEAIVLAERAGVDRARAWDVLQASAAGAPFVAYKRAAFLEPDATPTAFALQLAAKDLRLIGSLGDALGVPLAQARTNLAVVEEAAETQGPERDFALVASHLRARGDADRGADVPSGRDGSWST